MSTSFKAFTSGVRRPSSSVIRQRWLPTLFMVRGSCSTGAIVTFDFLVGVIAKVNLAGRYMS